MYSKLVEDTTKKNIIEEVKKKKKNGTRYEREALR